MNDLLPLVVIGVVNGSIYGLAGMGLVLTYKTSGVFNFAHGTVAAVAAYIMYDLQERSAHLPWPVAALVAVAIAGLLGGLVLERLAYALSTASTATRVVATVGLLVALQGLIVSRYGSNSIRVERFLPDGGVDLGGVVVRVDQILVTALGLAAAVGLYVFFRRTTLGVAMQGVVDDAALLGLQGRSPVAVRRWAWTIGTSFAAVSGILLAPDSGFADVNLLTLLVVQAFGAAAIGAFSSLPLTYLGGLVMGLLVAFCTDWVADVPALADLPANVPFLVLFLVLLVTPKRKLVERGARVVRRLPPPAELPVRARIVGWTIAGALILATPRLAGTDLPVYTEAMAFVILFASLGLLINTSGQVSLCHMAFAAVGAATAGHASGAGIPWVAAVLLGGLVALPIGAVVAIPAIRLRGVFLAVATLGFGILVEQTFFPTFLLFGASRSVSSPRPSLSFLAVDTDTGYFYVVAAAAALCCAAVVLVRRSRLGRLLRAMADSPAALAAHGTNTNVTRVFVFCISAFLAGVAGALIGPVTGSGTALTYQFFLSLVLVAVLALAGRQPVASAFVAAFLFKVGPTLLPDQALVDHNQVVFGVAAILVAVAPLRTLIERTAGSRRALGRGKASPVRARAIPDTVVTA